METYTMENWNADGELQCKIGQAVEERVIWALASAVPPTTWGGGMFQLGEAWDTDKETGEDLYDTFTKENGEWIYRGHCPQGKTEHRIGYYG